MRVPGPAVREVLAGLPAPSEGDPPRVDVTAAQWVPALTALAAAGVTYLDFLTAVDRPGRGGDPGALDVVAHLAEPGSWWHVLVGTSCPREAPELGTVTAAFAGAAWHERETAEMFGVAFTGHPNPGPLLLPDDLGIRPLRKDVVLVSRVAHPAPVGGEGTRGRRRLPPGVPDDWLRDGPGAGPGIPPSTDEPPGVLE